MKSLADLLATRDTLRKAIAELEEAERRLAPELEERVAEDLNIKPFLIRDMWTCTCTQSPTGQCVFLMHSDICSYCEEECSDDTG